MDDLVIKAMLKWPEVPDCYGWLGLDNRGQWYMRDDRVQAAGSFQSGNTQAKGSLLRHEKLISFIQRNYESDAEGRWFFQNGPQRVYVELESTPWIWRLDESLKTTSQTGHATEVIACMVDEMGMVYLHTALGLGLVHSLDVAQVANAIEQGIWTVENCESSLLSKIYGFVISPQAQMRRA